MTLDEYKRLRKLTKEKLNEKLSLVKKSKKKFSYKADMSIVTQMDLFISETIKTLSSSYHFYSEEDYTEFKYPQVIVDPIDGTWGYAMGTDECVLSFGFYNSALLKDENNLSWIYNFTNELELDSLGLVKLGASSIDTNMGLVSRNEMKNGKHNKSCNLPLGSIAYKLALLAMGRCRYVLSMNPKNIWDIMAGTHLCYQKNIFMYLNGRKVDSLDKEYYSGPILWCKEEDFLAISKMNSLDW